jgi:hypothetical protein
LVSTSIASTHHRIIEQETYPMLRSVVRAAKRSATLPFCLNLTRIRSRNSLCWFCIRIRKKTCGQVGHLSRRRLRATPPPPAVPCGASAQLQKSAIGGRVGTTTPARRAPTTGRAPQPPPPTHRHPGRWALATTAAPQISASGRSVGGRRRHLRGARGQRNPAAWSRPRTR